MGALPTFETERLILREAAEAHASDWQKHFHDYEVIRHLSHFVPWPYPDDGALIGVEPAKFVDPKLTEHEVWELKKEDWLKFRNSK